MTGTIPSPAAPGTAALRLATASEVPPAYRLQSGSAVRPSPSFRSASDHHLLRASDSALRALTDFAASPAFTVNAGCGIDDALDDMFRRGVRALIVLDERDAVIGLVTSYDIQGGRTQQYLNSHPTCRREQLRVREIMTSCAAWAAIDWREVRSARIDDVLEIFRSTGSPYLLILEAAHATTPQLLRGIISRSRLERQLGESV
jgi:CBS-domain-containing membrane protein